MQSKQAKEHQFDQKTQMKIWNRDRGCIFCTMEYKRPVGVKSYMLEVKDIMHYIPKSAGGLGIEENGAVGCRYHHHMMDNGNQGAREEMLQMFADYLRGKYPNWDEVKKTYSKWEGLKFVH